MLQPLPSWAVECCFPTINAAHGIKLIHHSDRSDLVWEAAYWQTIEAVQAELGPDHAAHQDAVLRNSRGSGWTASRLETMFHRARQHARATTGLPLPIRIHDLRGTYVTWLVARGLTDEEIDRIVGWKPGKIAEVRHRYVDEARVIVSLVERLAKGG